MAKIEEIQNAAKAALGLLAPKTIADAMSAMLPDDDDPDAESCVPPASMQKALTERLAQFAVQNIVLSKGLFGS